MIVTIVSSAPRIVRDKGPLDVSDARMRHMASGDDKSIWRAGMFGMNGGIQKEKRKHLPHLGMKGVKQ